MSDFVKKEKEKNSPSEEKITSAPTNVGDKEVKITNLPEKNYQRMLALFNKQTGVVEHMFPLKDKNLGEGWCAVYQTALAAIARIPFTLEEFRVFMKILSEVGFDNYLTVNHTKIAQEMEMNRPSFSRAIKGLVERSVLLEGERVGVLKTYRLNPFIAHRGAGRDKTIKEFEILLQKRDRDNKNK